MDITLTARLFKNGEYEPGGGKPLHFTVTRTMNEFLRSAADRIGMRMPVKIFNADGGLIDDVMFIDDGDPIFVARVDEPFKSLSRGSYALLYVRFRLFEC
jgi:hypothetical protein